MKKHEHMMHEDQGHIHHHLKAEHSRHGHRLHHEENMHKMHHKHSGSPYENETEHPHIPKCGKNEPMGPVDDFKGESMDTAYGQAGEHGCKSDQRKIHGQMKNYGWNANTGY
jgi:hypothetical protein